MKASDMTIIMCKIQSLNMHIEKDIERIKEDIEYWEEQIKEFGEDETVSGNTYGEVLTISKEQLKYKLKELQENYRLIDLLDDEVKNMYQV